MVFPQRSQITDWNQYNANKNKTKAKARMMTKQMKQLVRTNESDGSKYRKNI